MRTQTTGTYTHFWDPKLLLIFEFVSRKINARLHLTSSARDGGKFNVSTITTNSPVFVIVADAPVDSALFLEAVTTNGQAHVHLHPTYEGDFDIETSSQHTGEINILPGADPSGKERGRVSWWQPRNTSHVYGSTSWFETRNKKNPGNVNVHTSNSGRSY